MKRFLALTCIVSGALIASGCATKKYVRNTTAPVQAKVNEVGEQTAKNSQEIQENRSTIKQVDERAQSGISAAQERASTAQKSAEEAMNRANQVSQEATTGINRSNEAISDLRQSVANLDDYKLHNEVTVPFSFDKYQLSDEAKQDLDTLATNVTGAKRYFIAVAGHTDRTGTAKYNEELSRRRADAVVKYLVTRHNVPVYRIHMIGMGPEQPAEEGKTRAARAKNRRVEVKLFTAEALSAQGTTGGTPSPAPMSQR
jgi:outer membrane protein OmpA-like peptidoglycan-associated protein